MTFDAETLYELLPAIHRIRDARIAESLPDLLTSAEQAQLRALRAQIAAGRGLDAVQQRDLALLEDKRLRGPLKALLTILAEQTAGLEESIEQLYDDQFIETCAPWAVPYIADLIGHHAFNPLLQERLGSARAEVANTIRFRRRKGTAAVLEELAVSTTGWDAAVVEFFALLATTQYLNHPRPAHLATPDLRRTDLLEAAGSPLDRLPHTADVRRIATGAGRYGIPNVGVFLYRIGSRRLTDVHAFRVDDRRFTFSPLGHDTQLYNAAERETDITRLAGPLDVPLPITRRGLHGRLDDLYGPGRSLSIQVGTKVLGITPEGDVDHDAIEACDLSDLGSGAPGQWAHSGQKKVAIDPVLGRLMLPAATKEPVRVTYYYGSAADVGGGEYDRGPSADALPEPVRRVPADRLTVSAALADVGGEGTVQISTSASFRAIPALRVAADARVVVRAANQSRPLLWLDGEVVAFGGDSGELVLEGLLMTGGPLVVPAQLDGQPNQLQKLRVVHCTFVPGAARDAAAVSIDVRSRNVVLEIEHSIVGALRVDEGSRASVSASIVDGLGPRRVAYAAGDGGAGGPLEVTASTFVGTLATTELTASDAIFHAERGDAGSKPAVLVERRQTGYLRYCYVPDGSQLPPRYRCQPVHGQGSQPAIRPQFTSLRYGSPAYGQLHAACPREILFGGEHGTEMGVMHALGGAQRVAGLGVRLEEYLRFGLEAGLLFAS